MKLLRNVCRKWPPAKKFKRCLFGWWTVYGWNRESHFARPAICVTQRPAGTWTGHSPRTGTWHSAEMKRIDPLTPIKLFPGRLQGRFSMTAPRLQETKFSLFFTKLGKIQCIVWIFSQAFYAERRQRKSWDSTAPYFCAETKVSQQLIPVSFSVSRGINFRPFV